MRIVVASGGSPGTPLKSGTGVVTSPNAARKLATDVRSSCSVSAVNVGSRPPGIAVARGFQNAAAAPPTFPLMNRMLLRLFELSLMSWV